jgi:hypothetical protein
MLLLKYYKAACNIGGIGKGGRVVWPPGVAGPRGRKMGGKINILNKKIVCSTDFKILSQIKGNSINLIFFVIHNLC